MPEISKREIVFTTPWFELQAKTVAGENPEEPHYAIKEDDYVCVVALTENDEIVLVRQFRAAVEQSPWELPAGHVDVDEEPAQSAARELFEETGFKPERLEFLGCLLPDTGRMTNQLWCYFSGDLGQAQSGWTPEAGLEVVCLPLAEFWNELRSSNFKHALHLAAVFLAVAQGLLKLPTP